MENFDPSHLLDELIVMFNLDYQKSMLIDTAIKLKSDENIDGNPYSSMLLRHVKSLLISCLSSVQFSIWHAIMYKISEFHLDASCLLSEL